MSGKKPQENDELVQLRLKYLDIEESIIKIRTINNLLIAYADEHSCEVSVLASLISKELAYIFENLP